jgi:hypothetical protein
MTWPKGEKAGVAWPYTGRRVSSLVPWGGSEEPETVEVSQDVVYRRGEGYWEGERVGEGAGGQEKEMEQAGKEKEGKQAEEKKEGIGGEGEGGGAGGKGVGEGAGGRGEGVEEEEGGNGEEGRR